MEASFNAYDSYHHPHTSKSAKHPPVHNIFQLVVIVEHLSGRHGLLFILQLDWMATRVRDCSSGVQSTLAKYRRSMRGALSPADRHAGG